MGVDVLAVTESIFFLHFDRSSGDDDVQEHISKKRNGEGLGDKNSMNDIMLEECL